MSTITTLNSGDSGPVSRGVLNTNLANLNSDKIETSVISTDGTLASNSDAKLPSEKAVKTYVDSQALLTVETTTGTTHSLTTTAGQVVMVFVSGNIYNGSGVINLTVDLKYNGVTKHSFYKPNLSSPASDGFALQYTETPGAGTHDITVVTDGGTLTAIKIMVLKIG